MSSTSALGVSSALLDAGPLLEANPLLRGLEAAVIYLAKDYITFTILGKGYRTHPHGSNRKRGENSELVASTRRGI